MKRYDKGWWDSGLMRLNLITSLFPLVTVSGAAATGEPHSEPMLRIEIGLRQRARVLL